MGVDLLSHKRGTKYCISILLLLHCRTPMQSSSSTDQHDLSLVIYPPTIILGRLCRSRLGKNPLLEIRQSSIDINEYLPRRLPTVSQSKLYNYLRHRSFLGKLLIWAIRRTQVQTRPVQPESNGEELLFHVKYNFVLLGDGRLIFVRIPSRTKDYPYELLSKHAVLARHSSNVRFAGEMCFLVDKQTILVNNNSGTYQPTDEITPSAVAYLQRVFPHLVIRGISRHQPLETALQLDHSTRQFSSLCMEMSASLFNRDSFTVRWHLWHWSTSTMISFEQRINLHRPIKDWIPKIWKMWSAKRGLSLSNPSPIHLPSIRWCRTENVEPD